MKFQAITGNTINGIFKNINRGNWSGESVDVEVKDGYFQMYDYTFRIGEGEQMFYNIKGGQQEGKPAGAGFRLHMNDDDGESLYVDELATPEKIIRAAVQWVSNHV